MCLMIKTLCAPSKCDNYPEMGKKKSEIFYFKVSLTWFVMHRLPTHLIAMFHLSQTRQLNNSNNICLQCIVQRVNSSPVLTCQLLWFIKFFYSMSRHTVFTLKKALAFAYTCTVYVFLVAHYPRGTAKKMRYIIFLRILLNLQCSALLIIVKGFRYH